MIECEAHCLPVTRVGIRRPAVFEGVPVVAVCSKHTLRQGGLFSWWKESRIFPSQELSFRTLVFPFLLGMKYKGALDLP